MPNLIAHLIDKIKQKQPYTQYLLYLVTYTCLNLMLIRLTIITVLTFIGS